MVRQAAVVAAILLGHGQAWAASPSLQQLIKLHNSLDVSCRGGAGDEAATNKACDQREEVSKMIKGMGYCMAYPQYTWHRC